jgi:signal transduction histidine kinase
LHGHEYQHSNIAAPPGPAGHGPKRKSLQHFSHPPTWTWGRWVQVAIYAVCAGAFIADLNDNGALAFGVFYIPLLATAVFHRDPRATWWLAGLASALVVIGFFTPSICPDLVTSLINRGLSLAAIFTTAYLLHHDRDVRDKLKEQTARAETADRIRERLLNNLSHELRTPLAAILGYADLLQRNARPEQLGPLGYIHAGGRRLLATVDNLIDLTQIEDRTIRIRPLDLPGVLAHAVEASRPIAAERQIALTLVPSQDNRQRVLADGWALRRIIDNLIANGIKFTEPGGSVEVSMRQTTSGIAVEVRDTGPGMPPHVLEQLGEPFFQADAGTARRFEGMGTGLALSLRLADAMGTAVHFDSAPGQGTIASFVLPMVGSDMAAIAADYSRSVTAAR